jgi:hypothetical protein
VKYREGKSRKRDCTPVQIVPLVHFTGQAGQAGLTELTECGIRIEIQAQAYFLKSEKQK